MVLGIEADYDMQCVIDVGDRFLAWVNTWVVELPSNGSEEVHAESYVVVETVDVEYEECDGHGDGSHGIEGKGGDSYVGGG